jgi:hypothetical protein
MDPLAGSRAPGAAGAAAIAIGIAKGLAGVALRPAAAMVESTSRALHGLGLVCLGTAGISGRMARRARAPEALLAGAFDGGSGGSGSGGGAPSGAQVHKAALLEAWQGAVGHLVPAARGDAVVDVLAARPDRVLLLTDHHVACLRAAHRGGATTYALKWVLRRDSVLHVHGADASWRILLHSHRPVALGRVALSMPVRRSIRCATAEVFHALVQRLNRHVSAAGDAPPDAGAGDAQAAPALADLSIVGGAGSACSPSHDSSSDCVSP